MGSPSVFQPRARFSVCPPDSYIITHILLVFKFKSNKILLLAYCTNYGGSIYVL
nr:MAG TPA: hypothetical protein [Caudoviricetes sp.]